MYPYIANTDSDKKQMLEKINLSKMEDLYQNLPEDLVIKELDLPKAKSELEVKKYMQDLASKNKTINDLTCFMGAGSYDHYIPSVVHHLIGRSEFYTAYTPYQPEVSQGTLQSIFEYQSMLCELTGMDVSSISMYDVSTAMAEAAVMAVESTRRKKVIVSETVTPQSRETLKTYAHYRGYEVVEVEEEDGVTNLDKLKSMIDKDTAAVIIQTPNFFGIIEELEDIEKLVHSNKSLLVLSVDPISLGVLKTPADCGADIVIGDCQPFGIPVGFGGPYLGFFNTTKKLMRKMPGRIVGQTEDVDGNRGFVLTIQTREQHIRREKATSNICSDQTLLAIGAAIYLSTIGKQGIKEIGEHCIKKSHYAQKVLIESGKYKPLFNKPFFKEFVLTSDIDKENVKAELYKNNILGGYDIGSDYPKYNNALMYCVTEKRTKNEIDFLKETMEVIS